MWESKTEKEAYQQLEEKRDEMSLRGGKKLKYTVVAESAIWITITFVSRFNLPLALIVVILLTVSVFGIFTNRSIGFYSFVTFLILGFVLNSVLMQKLVIFISAVLSGSGYDKLSVFVSIGIIFLNLILYCVAIKVVAFDKDVTVWRKFRRHRH